MKNKKFDNALKYWKHLFFNIFKSVDRPIEYIKNLKYYIKKFVDSTKDFFYDFIHLILFIIFPIIIILCFIFSPFIATILVLIHWKSIKSK